MAIKIITGMKFIDIRKRKFIITDTYFMTESKSNMSFVIETTDDHRIHFNGSLKDGKLTDIGFKEIGKTKSEPIIRSIIQIQKLVEKKLIVFY